MKNIIFMGEKPLGLKCLKYLFDIKKSNIIGICTRKKTNVWWGKQLVRDFAEQNNIPLIKRKEIKNYNVDIIISVLYPFIIEQEIISLAKQCAINLHQAPLPEYKGCNSASHAIINGENKFGCTLHLIDKELDSGEIIDKRFLDINKNYNAKDLYEKVDKLCFLIFKDNIENILSNNYKSYPQDMKLESKTYERDSLSNKEANLNWSDEKLWNFVRGMEFYPFESAFIQLSKNRKIYLTTKKTKK
jgi:methionyl-tRNA formyltransferase